MQHNDLSAANRMSDAVNLAALNGDTGKWLAFSLSDGSTDHTAYDSRSLAVYYHKWDADRFCYLQVPPGGMQPKEAESYLNYFRQLYTAGARFYEPAFAMPMMPLTKEDQNRQIQVLVKGI